MVMVDAWMHTPSGALHCSPHQRSRRRPKLIMRPITSAAFSEAFAFASAAFAFGAERRRATVRSHRVGIAVRYILHP